MKAQLALSMQTQQQDRWCWAAVSVSVAGYFNTPGPTGGSWQQCEIVNAELGQTTCCQNGSTSSCNQDWYLDRALQRVGHLASGPNSGAMPFASVQAEINANRPVGVRIGWFQGGGHFVVLRGYDDTGAFQSLDVEDPWYGPSTYDYQQFAAGYQSGAGAWTHTYPLA